MSTSGAEHCAGVVEGAAVDRLEERLDRLELRQPSINPRSATLDRLLWRLGLGDARGRLRRGCGATSCRARRRGGSSLRANAISESVPHSPPTAITSRPRLTTARLRAWPIPVAIAVGDELVGLARPRCRAGRRSPRLPPSARRAMRPPSRRCHRRRPPWHPASASSRPTDSAWASSSSSPVAAPITETWTPRVIGQLASGLWRHQPLPSASSPSAPARPPLWRCSFRFPHFGLWTQEGQPSSQGHSRIRRSASPTSRSNSS